MKRLLEAPSVILNSYDVSGDVHGLELMGGREPPQDHTGLSDTFKVWAFPNIRRWGVKLDFFNNFDGTSMTPTGINVVLHSVFNSMQTSGVQITIRATSNARSVANPEWQGQVQIDGDFEIMAGNVAGADKGSVMLRGAGALSWFTSSSS